MKARDLRVAALVCGVAAACGGDAAPGDGAAMQPQPITIKTFPGGAPYGGATANVALVAFQDGDDTTAWQVLQGTGGVYTATATGVPYAVATACSIADAARRISNVTVQYLTIWDATEVMAAGCADTPATVHVTIDVQGVATGLRARASLGGRVAAAGSAGGPLEVDVPIGDPLDLVIESVDDSNVPARIYRVAAGVARANQALAYDLSVLGAAPDRQALALTSSDGVAARVVESRLNMQPTRLDAAVATSLASPTIDHYLSVPIAGGRLADDLTDIVATASEPGAADRGTERFVALAMKTPAAITQALPAAWPVATPVLDAAPTRRATWTIAVTPPALQTVDYHAAFSTSQGGQASTLLEQHALNIAIGAARATSPMQPTVTLTTPDLSGLPGWAPEMALLGAQATTWMVERDDRNMRAGPTPVDGQIVLGNRVTGSLPAIGAP